MAMLESFYSEIDLGPYMPEIQAVIDNYDPNKYDALLVMDLDQTIFDCLNVHYTVAKSSLLPDFPDDKKLMGLTLADLVAEGCIYDFFKPFGKRYSDINELTVKDPILHSQMPH